MNTLEIDYHDTLAAYVKRPMPITHLISEFFNFYMEKKNNKILVKKAVSIVLKNDFIVLLESYYVDEPRVRLLPQFDGQTKTLSFSCDFVVDKIKIVGKMRTSNVNYVAEYAYMLEVYNLKISVTKGFYIVANEFGDGAFYQQLKASRVDLTYKKGEKYVALLEKEQDQKIRSALEQYLLRHCLEDLTNQLMSIFDIHFSKIYVTDVLGRSRTLRDIFRIHEKTFKLAFSRIIDKLADVTNNMIEKNTEINRTIPWPNIFAVTYKPRTPSYGEDTHTCTRNIQIFHGALRITKSAMRACAPTLLMRDECVLVYMPLYFYALEVHYKDGDDYKLRYYQTDITKSHLLVSIKKIEPDRAAINFIEFKATDFTTFDTYESHFIFDHYIQQAVEEKLSEYLKLAVKDEELCKFVANQPDVEIEYDSDDFMAYDSDDDPRKRKKISAY